MSYWARISFGFPSEVEVSSCKSLKSEDLLLLVFRGDTDPVPLLLFTTFFFVCPFCGVLCTVFRGDVGLGGDVKERVRLVDVLETGAGVGLLTYKYNFIALTSFQYKLWRCYIRRILLPWRFLLSRRFFES